jgi:hypothetical protein
MNKHLPFFTAKAPCNDQVLSKPDYDAAIARGLDDNDACGEALVVETAGNTDMAEFITRACNNHDALLAALKGMMEAFVPFCERLVEDEGERALQSDVRRARTAIINAEKEVA